MQVLFPYSDFQWAYAKDIAHDLVGSRTWTQSNVRISGFNCYYLCLAIQSQISHQKLDKDHCIIQISQCQKGLPVKYVLYTMRAQANGRYNVQRNLEWTSPRDQQTFAASSVPSQWWPALAYRARVVKHVSWDIHTCILKSNWVIDWLCKA